ncbi:DUF3800 domain-containing protein [Fervidobacterium sp.]
MPTIFVDEYGTPWKNGRRAYNDPRDIFAIIGVYFRDRKAYCAAEQSFLDLKDLFFYSRNVVAHDQKMRKGNHPFYAFRDSSKRDDFYREFAQRAANWDYEIFLAIIDQPNHFSKYISPSDPYRIALQFMLERFEYNKRIFAPNSIDLVLESRGKSFDSILTCVIANRCRLPSLFSYSPPNYHSFFFKKDDRVAGLEIADLLLASAWRMEYNANIGTILASRPHLGPLGPAKVEPFDIDVYNLAVKPKYLKPFGVTSSPVHLKFFP